MEKINGKLFERRKYMGKIVKGKTNPFTNSKYTDINSVLHATEPVLEELGLLFTDTIDSQTLQSRLTDMESGEFIESQIPLILVKNDMQAYGSAITYARRYARITMLSLETVDDDGSGASGQSFAKPAQIKKINTLMLECGVNATETLRQKGVSAVKDLYEGNALDLIKSLESIKKMKGSLDEK